MGRGAEHGCPFQTHPCARKMRSCQGWRTRQLPSSLAPQSQKKEPYLAYEISWSLWQTLAHTVQTPTPSTILQVWQWYLHGKGQRRASEVQGTNCSWHSNTGHRTILPTNTQTPSTERLPGQIALGGHSPVLVHELFLRDGERAELVAEGVFVLTTHTQKAHRKAF